MTGLKVEIRGCNDTVWPVHGRGSSGPVRMGKGQVEGLFEAPVRTAWVSSATQSGGTMKGKWNEYRDLSLGFHILGGQDHAAVYSAFRMAFDYREDEWDHDAELAHIDVTSEHSGTRTLDVQLYEQADYNPGIDPLTQKYGNLILPLRAGQPMYYETPVVTSWSTSSSAGSGLIEVENPTDQIMRHKWILTRGQWTLPDVSWEGKKGERRPGLSKLSGRDDSSRAILMPTIGVLEGGCTVDLDPMKLMVRDAADTNLLGRMPVPGRYFEYAIPPYTQKQFLPVSVTNAPAGGAMVQLVQPRLWSLPVGGELW